MYVPVLNYFIDVEEAIVVLCVVIVAYLAVLHIEFKQLKIISRKFSEEDNDFSKCLRELREDLNKVSDIAKDTELRKISSRVSGADAASMKQKAKSSPKNSFVNSEEDESDSLRPSKDSGSGSDTKSLKDMLDKV